ncbi:DUF6163 family protein [Methylobrevis pamukkalensis]|uniref:DoxX n=1 Tax=Methylobrevis pamukkalensis TaxID=1439726 RepID=A0A1E3GTF3_9HYPH|nr:DUF6163 family protein [Methylobrevis pamukkalensis]ODN66836.1 hypothetical protein A6302_04423 [Methylobrevis pamukkalensis]
MRDDEAMNDALPETGRRFDPRFALVVFVRLLAVVFLVSGLHDWSVVLSPPGGGNFFDLPLAQRVATVFFAVCDLVAAVGLWLLASWGAVVWLIAALTEVALHAFFADVFGTAPVTVGFHMVSVVIYTVFTYLVDRAAESS